MKTLRELHQEHSGKVSDKWDIYLSEYNNQLESYRKKEVSLLEIGVQNGGSLEIWNKFFPYAKVLVGCDINKDCDGLKFDSPKINVVAEDANTDIAENKITELSSSFDIIIDDGSHTSGDIVNSFSRYFPYLKDGGIYIAEDLHCSYWSEFQGGLYDFSSSISFFKQLADVLNYEHWGVEVNVKDMMSIFKSKYGASFSDEMLSHVHSVLFFNSVCIVRKREPNENKLGCRNVTGTDEKIVQGHIELAGQKSAAIRQSMDVDSLTHPSIRLQRYKMEMLRLENQVKQGKKEIEVSKNLVEQIQNSKSWKITIPLRNAGVLFRSLKSNVKAPIAGIKVADGIRPAFHKALSLYRREGVSGIARGIHFLGGRGADPKWLARNNYREWVLQYDTIDDKELACLSEKAALLEVRPLISIVMPVYNPNLAWLTEAIESVRSQVYPDWELCIADDCSTNPKVRKFLSECQEKDKRIKVVYREENGHISRASNSALEIANGSWIALLDQDDIIPAHALYHVAKSLNDYPDTLLMYSDEDKINEKGARFNPYFKTDFNRHLFYSHNMVSHLGVYSADLVNKVGGFRTGVEGSQDYDLALRCIEEINESQVRHIPRVLYHWRVHSESTAGGGDAKPYAMLAGEKVLNEHFVRTGRIARSSYIGSCYRTNYALPEIEPSVSIIIPTKNNFNLISSCIENIFCHTAYQNYEVVVVDNGSSDSDCITYFEYLNQSDRSVRVLSKDIPFNYSKLNNYAVSQSNSDVVVLLNDDVEIKDKEWLGELVSFAAQREIGAVGPKLLYPDGRVQHAGIILGLMNAAGHAFKFFHDSDPGYFGRANFISEFSAVTGACLAVERKKYLDVGGLDEDNFAVAYNDVDFCLKLKRQGLVNVMTPFCRLIHHESITRGPDHSPEKVERLSRERDHLIAKWQDVISNDPCYNPNLTLEHEDFSLSWPPRVK